MYDAQNQPVSLCREQCREKVLYTNYRFYVSKDFSCECKVLKISLYYIFNEL